MHGDEAYEEGWRPNEQLRWHLIPGEQIIYHDAPALNAFIVDELPTILILAAAVIGAAFAAAADEYLIAGMTLIATGVLLLYLHIKRWLQNYTIYVLTSVRVLRLTGFFNLEAAWIPWGKVTDVRIERSLLGRWFGYATVFIESANEASGFNAMRNLHDPKAFYLKLTAMVQLKQGNEAAASEVVPVLWD